jgi:hypothetical protein
MANPIRFMFSFLRLTSEVKRARLALERIAACQEIALRSSGHSINFLYSSPDQEGEGAAFITQTDADFQKEEEASDKEDPLGVHRD